MIDPAELVPRAQAEGGADVVLELVGGPNLDADLLALAAKGRIVIVGTGAGAEATLDLRKLMGRRARLLGTMLRARPLDEKATAMRAFTREVVPHLASGRIAPLVDRVFPARRGGGCVRPARASRGSSARCCWISGRSDAGEPTPARSGHPEQLVRVGHRDPPQDAVRVRLVVAHAPERGRVAVERDRRASPRRGGRRGCRSRRSRTARRPRAASSARGSSRPRRAGSSPRTPRPRRRRPHLASDRDRGSPCPASPPSRSARCRCSDRGTSGRSAGRPRRSGCGLPRASARLRSPPRARAAPAA